jgi:hypothetical protein
LTASAGRSAPHDVYPVSEKTAAFFAHVRAVGSITVADAALWLGIKQGSVWSYLRDWQRRGLATVARGVIRATERADAGQWAMTPMPARVHALADILRAHGPLSIREITTAHGWPRNIVTSVLRSPSRRGVIALAHGRRPLPQGGHCPCRILTLVTPGHAEQSQTEGHARRS